MIKAVSFDFWETLFAFVSEKELEEVRKARLKRFKNILSLPEEKISEAYNRTLERLLQEREKTGYEFTVAEMISDFLRELGVPANYLDPCKEAFVSAILERIPTFNPNVPECLESLKKIGLKLCIVSNTIHGDVEKKLLSEHGLIKFFDLVVLSSEIRVRKPRREIFLYAASRLGVKPAEVIHIGDNLEADVLGALNAGMWSAWYNPATISPFPHFIIRNFLEVPEIVRRI